MDKKALEKVEFPAGLPQLPTDGKDLGDSDIRPDDVKLPRWRLLQQMSPEVSQEMEYSEGNKYTSGMFLHQTTGDILSKETWHKILVAYQFQGRVFFPPENYKTEKKMLCQSHNNISSAFGFCGMNKVYETESTKPENIQDRRFLKCDCKGQCCICEAAVWRDGVLLCGNTQNFIALVPSSKNPIEPGIFAFMKGSIKNTGEYLTYKKSSPKVRMGWFKLWTEIGSFKTTDVKKGKTVTWYKPQIRFCINEEPPMEKWQRLAYSLLESFRGREIAVDHSIKDTSVPPSVYDQAMREATDNQPEPWT